MGWKTYAYPENVKNLLNLLEEQRKPDEIRDLHRHIDQEAAHFKKLLKQHAGNEISVTYAYLKQADKEIEKHIERNKDMAKDIRCGKGCAFCCEINVSCSAAEADLVLQAVVQDNIPLDWDKVVRAAERGDDYDIKDVPREERQCVFLDPATKMCRVYEYRPGICRTYFSLEDPKHCDIEGPVHRIKRFFSAMADLVVAGIWNAEKPESLDSLPKQLLKARNRLITPQK